MNTYQIVLIALGIWVGTLSVHHPWVIGLMLLACLLLIGVGINTTWVYMPLLVVIGMSAGFGVAYHANHNQEHEAINHLITQHETVSMTVELRDDPGKHGTPAIIQHLPNHPNVIGQMVWIQGELDGYAGSVFTINGVLSEPAQGFGSYLKSRGINAIIRGPTRHIRDPTSWWDRSTAVVHQRVGQATQNLEPTEAGLLLGLALGDERKISPEDSQAMRDSGLSHLTAVSGSNVAMITGALLALAWLLVLGRQVGRILALVGVWWFVWLVRGDPSVVRAAVMASIVLGTSVLGRPVYLPHSLGVTVIGALLLDPRIGQQAGFCLSVAATTGVLAGTQIAKQYIEEHSLWWKQTLVLTIGASIGATLVTTPVLLIFGMPLQPVSPWANVLVTIVATLAQWGAVLTTVLSTIHTGLASWCASLTALPIRGLLCIARLAADPMVGEYAMIANWGVGNIAILLWTNRLIGTWVVIEQGDNPNGQSGMSRGQFLFNAAMLFIAIRWFPWRFWSTKPPPQPIFIALDVGQGDALLIGDPIGGWMLIDTGPDPKRLREHLQTFGVGKLRAVVITHAHTDHTGGLDRVLASIPCDQVMVSPAQVEAEAPRTINVRRIATKRQVPVVEIAQGDRFLLGKVTFEVLHPKRDAQQLEPNDASLVIQITGPSGKRILTTGDAEAQAQWEMARILPQCDVLKVPHHGGNTNASGFLSSTGARMAVICCGKGNDYGHPHPDVLAQLGAMHVHRTDLHGNCEIPL